MKPAKLSLSMTSPALREKTLMRYFYPGAVSLLLVENPMASSSKNWFYLQDTSGSSIVPLLLEGYSEIHPG